MAEVPPDEGFTQTLIASLMRVATEESTNKLKEISPGLLDIATKLKNIPSTLNAEKKSFIKFVNKSIKDKVDAAIAALPPRTKNSLKASGAYGQPISAPPISGESINTPINGEAINAPINGESINTPINGEAINAPISGEAINAPISGEAINAPISGEAINAPISGEAINAPISGEAISGEAMNGEANGEAMNGEAISGEAISGEANEEPIYE